VTSGRADCATDITTHYIDNQQSSLVCLKSFNQSSFIQPRQQHSSTVPLHGTGTHLGEGFCRMECRKGMEPQPAKKKKLMMRCTS
jgi:hypothetical protein